jgi:carbonic anhydrase/acetyltransferase-like protein (isoleucine patch superfamily)
MSVPISPVTNNQVFGTWLARTNQMAGVITANAVTTDNTVLGGFTNGNGTVNGYFGSNTLFARDAIRGGNVTVSNTGFVTSNLVYQYSVDGTRNDSANLIYITSNTLQSNLYANITFVDMLVSANTRIFSNNFVANIVSNVYVISNNLNVNTASNTSIVTGNLTVNTISNTYIYSNSLIANVTSNVFVNSNNLIVNTTSNAFITTNNLIVNTSANAFVKSNNFIVNTTSNGYVNSNNLNIIANNISTVGNVYINSSASYTVLHVDGPSNTVTINAASVNVYSNTTLTGTNTTIQSNAYVWANLTVNTDVYIGNSANVFNTANVGVKINVGANVNINTSAIQIGNTVANLNANSINLTLANSLSTYVSTPSSLLIGGLTLTPSVNISNNTGNSVINPTTVIISNTTSAVVTANVSGIFVTNATVNATTHTAGPNATFSNVSLTWTGNTSNSPTITLANTGSFVIGNNSGNSTNITVNLANSTGNVVITPTAIQLSNATSNVFVANTLQMNVYSPVTFSNNLFVAGANTTVNQLTVNSASQFNNTVTVGNTINFIGANIAGNFYIGGSGNIAGDLHISGNLTYNGVSAASIIPSANLFYTVGNTSLIWNVGYIDIINSNTVNVSNASVSNLNVSNVAIFSNTVLVKSILTANVGIKLQDGSVFNSLANTTTGTFTQTVDSFDITVYRSAEYTISIKDTTNSGSSFQVSKLLVVHDGATPYITEYSVIATNINPMGVFAASIAGSILNLQFTPNTNITSATLKIARISLVV